MTQEAPVRKARSLQGRGTAWIAGISIAALVSSGCAQTGLAGPGAAAGALDRYDLTGASATNRDLTLRILETVLPGSPDYFPRKEGWGEYVFELRTHDVPVRIESAVIVSSEGLPSSMALDSEQLLETPKVGETVAKQVGVTGAAAAGSLLLGAAIPFVGPALMAGAAAYRLKPLFDADERIAYRQEFLRRTGQEHPYLESNARLVRSAFFPLVPEARSLVLEYRTGPSFATLSRLEISISRDRAPTAPVRGQPVSVSGAQQRLNELGYDAGPADGILGDLTARALSAYQRDSGLTPSGQLDVATRERLQAP